MPIVDIAKPSVDTVAGYTEIPGDSENPLLAGKWYKMESVITLDTSWVDPIADIIDKIKEFLNMIAQVVDTVLNTLLLAADALVEAIRAVLNAIKETVEGILEDLNIYLLVVPIRKRFMTSFAGLGDVTPPNWAGNFAAFSNQYNARYPDVTPQQAEFYAKLNRYNGGNYGYFRTVLESLQDPGDRCRPQFTSPNDYVGGAIFLMGTDLDPFGLLDDLWSFLGLFGGLLKDSGLRKVPKPKNLRAQVISVPSKNAAEGKMTVLLKWDTLEIAETVIPDFGSLYLKPERYAVIRIKNDPSCGRANTVADLTATRELTKGLKFGNAEVIEEAEFNISSVTYMDVDVPVTKKDTYYYAVAWKLKGAGTVTAWVNIDELIQDATAAAKEVSLGYYYMSNIVRVTPFPSYPKSTPPDWIRPPSIEELLPEFGYLLRKLVMYLESVADKFISNVDYLKQYVQMLKDEVARYNALAQYILDQLKKLLNLFALPSITGGLYMRTFFGQGGNDYFLRELGAGLSGGEENAPPFTAGTEYVTGLVLMTGGPQYVVEPVMSLINLLWGGSVPDPLWRSLTDLQSSLSSLEDINDFGGDMSVEDLEKNEAALEEYNDQAKCERSPEVQYQFGEDMGVTR